MRHYYNPSSSLFGLRGQVLCSAENDRFICAAVALRVSVRCEGSYVGASLGYGGSNCDLCRGAVWK